MIRTDMWNFLSSEGKLIILLVVTCALTFLVTEKYMQNRTVNQVGYLIKLIVCEYPSSLKKESTVHNKIIHCFQIVLYHYGMIMFYFIFKIVHLECANFIINVNLSISYSLVFFIVCPSLCISVY